MSLEFSLVEKCHARFIKKISQLKGDIPSCRCKNFNLKVVSVRSDGGGGSGPPGPSPWIRHCAIIGLLYIMISYVCYETARNYQFHPKKTIPVKIQ